MEASAFERSATVAEKFDLTVLKMFSQMPVLAMVERLLNEAESRAGGQKLGPLIEAVHSRILQLNEFIARESSPRAIPIEKLVKIQLQSALICLKELDSRGAS